MASKTPLKLENTESQFEEANGATFFRTCFNGINLLLGVGILSVPYALSQGGWLSLLLFFSVASLCWYTGLLLQRCMDSNPLIKSFPDIGHAAFGRTGRLVVCVFMYLELYLAAVEFLILEGDNLSKMFPNASLDLAGHTVGGKQLFVLAASLIVLPTTWLKDLSLQAYLSAGGILASIVLVVCVFWVGAFDGVGFHERGVLLNRKGLSTSLSLYLFCYAGHAVFPTLCNSMKHRSQFPKVLLVCFITSTLVYGSLGVLGYLIFGEYLESQITLNLPVHTISTKIAVYVTIVSPLTMYALVLTPVATSIQDSCNFRNSTAATRILLRTAMVISTVFMALMIPFFGYLMAFVGASMSTTVSIILPCLFNLKINKVARRFGFEFVILVGIMVIGFLVSMVGTFSSVRDIVNHL